MEKYFTEYGIVLNEKQKEQFKRYCELLIEYNERFNLTAITEKREIYIKHFIDSALAVELLKGENLADVGSGGGFPALPLKIIKPELEVTLIEATEKKCEFLKEIVGQLGLTGVKVVCGRAEDLAKNPDYREKFDICTARAVARLNVLAEYCLPFVKKGGYLYYSTCSVLPEENSGTVRRFLDKRKDFVIEPINSPLPHENVGGANAFLPDISGGSGFFVAKLKRI